MAVVEGGETLTYGALNVRADHLARRLCRLGVGLESRVALCLERSLDLVVGVLGVLKAGAAYVPLDPGQPRERLRLILADAFAGERTGVVVTHAKTAEAVLGMPACALRLDRPDEEDSRGLAAPAAADPRSGTLRARAT